MLSRLQTVCVCALLCTGCTLAFDSDSVEFSQPEARDAGGVTDTDQQPDATEVDVPRPMESLGALCGIQTPRCVPEDEGNWPACAHAQCQALLGEGSECVLASSPYGFCTNPCNDDSQCLGDPNDAFAASMRCVLGSDGSGYCLPGSQAPCAQNGVCPAGEACKLTRTVVSGGLELSVVCQSVTPGGAAPGTPCVDDPRRSRDGVVRFCKNDFCFDDVCTSFCDPLGDEGQCGSPDLACRTDYFEMFDYSTTRRSPPQQSGLCLPSVCDGPGSCQEEAAVCTPGLTERQGEVREQGVCRSDNPASVGSRALGEGCLEDGAASSVSCGSRFCTGFPPNFYCSALCDSHSDCGADQLCSVSRRYDETGLYFSRICRYAPGSKQRCDRNEDPACLAGEICAPYVFGTVTDDGQKIGSSSIEGRCIRPVQGGIRSGNACGEQECVAPDACVRFPEAETAQCVTVCGNGLHCENVLDVCLAQAVFVSEDETVDGQELVLGICSL